VKDFFESLVDLEPSERLTRLSELADTELAAEVRELLENYDAAGSQFLTTTVGFATCPTPSREFVFSAGAVLASRFSILRPLGKGGMGEVYEAEDLELGERVAIKCIHADAVGNAETERLFRREIHIARQITHRNVCRVHDLFLHSGPGGASILLSMELIEGETLHTRLVRGGPMSIVTAEPLIRQLLAGLAAAHECGVVHRDLKPGNLMLTREGNEGPERLVIMDFGLARSFQKVEPGTSVARSIFGTFEYMAPEQLLGESVPASDIYAVGLIVFEMLTGEKPFEGDPLMQAMRRLVDPPRRPRSLKPQLTAAWEQVILQCLQREPTRRFPNSQQVALALAGQLDAPKAAGWRLWERRRRTWAVALVVLLGLATLVVLRQSREDTNFGVSLAPLTTGGGVTMYSTISDDNSWLAYTSDRETQSNLQLWLQRLGDEGSRRRLTQDSFDVSSPSFSPDGKQLVFRWEREGGGLYEVDVPGGEPRLLVREGIEGRYSPDGTQIVSWTGEQAEHPVVRGRIFLIPTAGGQQRAMPTGFDSVRRPVWLPDGRHILFEGSKDPTKPFEATFDWYILDLDSGTSVSTGAGKGLREAGLRVYSGSGNFRGDRVVFTARTETAANVYRYRFDMRTFHAIGKPEQLTFTTQLMDSPWIARNGNLVVTDLQGELNIWEASFRNGRLGKERKLTNTLQYDSHPTISADGTQVAFARSLGPERQIWIHNSAGERRLETSRDEKYWPVIRPDGSEIAYGAGPERSIYVVSTRGGAPVRLCESCGDPTGWSHTGRSILVTSGQPSHIMVLDRDTGESKTMFQGASDLAEAQFSPDDRFAVFRETLDESRSRLVLGRVPKEPVQGGSWKALTDATAWNDKPHWSADGHSIYFVSNRDGFPCLWSVAFDLGGDGRLGIPHVLRHFHAHSFTLGEVSRTAFNFAIGGEKMVLNPAGLRGNIWMGQITGVH
jgi:serine/threonine protein kinase